MTALLDAGGRASTETGDRLGKMAEHDRPGLVVLVIITDGHENSSHEFTRPQIRSMIELQQKTYNWQFTFLGANQDAFAEAGALGIAPSASANYATRSATSAFAGASANVGRMRLASASGQHVNCSYTPEEQAAMVS